MGSQQAFLTVTVLNTSSVSISSPGQVPRAGIPNQLNVGQRQPRPPAKQELVSMGTGN